MGNAFFKYDLNLICYSTKKQNIVSLTILTCKKYILNFNTYLSILYINYRKSRLNFLKLKMFL